MDSLDAEFLITQWEYKEVLRKVDLDKIIDPQRKLFPKDPKYNGSFRNILRQYHISLDESVKNLHELGISPKNIKDEESLLGLIFLGNQVNLHNNLPSFISGRNLFSDDD